MSPVREVDVARFRRIVARRLGLHFDADRDAFLSGVLERSAGPEGPGAYLGRLEAQGPPVADVGGLVQELTVPETYFFRHHDQLRAFAEVALPDRVSSPATAERLAVVSAGCASGEEAYSLSIVLKESAIPPHWRVSVRAVDISATALARADRATYTAWSLRETPAEMRQRWFLPRKHGFELDPGVRSSVTFEQRNLALPQPDLWARDSCDVVFCRNLLMYFTPEAARSLLRQIAVALAPGGYLFIGHAETLRGLSDDFELCDSHRTFYYRRRGVRVADREPSASLWQTERRSAEQRDRPIEWRDGPGEWRDGPAEQRDGPAEWRDGPVATTFQFADSGPPWLESVQRAAARIETLACASAAGVPPVPEIESAAAPEPPSDLQAVLGGLASERFAEGMEILDRLPPARADEPDVALLRAVLHVHAGRLSEAEALCESLLARNALSADASYVVALCREAAGDGSGAVELDRMAASLDPTFAMPRLHLGLMARRAGRRASARRELDRAADLLVREDPTRVLLFGGGFGREGLIALCRAEAIAHEGRRR